MKTSYEKSGAGMNLFYYYLYINVIFLYSRCLSDRFSWKCQMKNKNNNQKQRNSQKRM